MATASSSCSGSTALMTLEELPCGVVRTFKPSEAESVGYLYRKMMMLDGGRKQTFPELDIYGASGMVPWAIWDSFEAIKFPHQEFMYFYTRTKKLGSKATGKRSCRTIGCGGTWREDTIRPVYVNGVAEPFGKVRKLKYQNENKDFVHHSCWLMEEFSINHKSVAPSDLVLCRIKMNEAAMEKRKREFSALEDEEEKARRTKSHKPEEQLIIEQEQSWDISNYDPQTCFDVVDSDDEQIVEKHGSSIAQQQHIPTYSHLDSNCSIPDSIVSTNVIEDTEIQDTSWIEGLLELDGGETPTQFLSGCCSNQFIM